MATTLDRIPKDGIFRVTDLNSANASVSRLMSMGLLPGKIIRLVHLAPLGDPIAVEFDSCQISLRLEDAAEVSVEAVDA
jgi:Fe2+ transport system protein FeoA